MPKLRLKFTLVFVQALMAVKRGLVFIFGFFSRNFLERVGWFITHFLLFPVYKLYLKFRSRFRFSLLIILTGQKFLFFSLALLSLLLAGSQTKAFGSNHYLSGQQSLLYKYLGPDEEFSEIVEDSVDTVYTPGSSNNWQTGVSVSAGLGQASPLPTERIIGYSADGAALLAPTIMPGVSFVGPREIIKYVVQSGDTLADLARRYHITVETILIENKITARTVLRPGTSLTILPLSGISHKIKKGDTLKKLAATYRADPLRIAEFNQLSEDSLPVGEVIVIPEGRLPNISSVPSGRPAQTAVSRPPSAVNLARGMLWPTGGRRISQYFNWRHSGLDIAIPIGTPIYASDDGVVEKSGWNTGGYGYMVLINHGNGIKTLYAHNSKLFAKVGERVNKGEVIALAGSTGRSTGSHLHYEVRVGGVRVNPLYYVK